MTVRSSVRLLTAIVPKHGRSGWACLLVLKGVITTATAPATANNGDDHMIKSSVLVQAQLL